MSCILQIIVHTCSSGGSIECHDEAFFHFCICVLCAFIAQVSCKHVPKDDIQSLDANSSAARQCAKTKDEDFVCIAQVSGFVTEFR